MTAPPGRWPANVILSPGMAAALDEQTGDLSVNGPAVYHRAKDDAKQERSSYTVDREGGDVRPGYGDSGGASRFFTVANDTHPQPPNTGGRTPMPQIIHDDALTALRAMPDNSVDAVVTDPPYGLSNTTPDKVADTIVRWASGDREYTPKGRGFMGQAWDAFVPPPAVWDECYRVLKPGGHLVVFAGSRTQDLMGISIRLAQFEIRENVAWMYGSGFPKSLDVSKAIDKGGHLSQARAREFTEWMRSTGITSQQINEATGTNMASHYLTDKTQPAVAVADLFDKLRPYLPEVPERIERLVAERTGISWADYQAREVIGTRVGVDTRTSRLGFAGATYGGDSGRREFADTKAHTPEAEKWQGWGTALKPSHEPVICAVKPLDIPGLLAGIGSHLDALELTCRRNASRAAKSSAPTPADSSAAKTGSAPESAVTPPEAGSEKTTATGAAGGSFAQTATSASEWMDETFSNTVTSWRACWAELCELTSTSTTSTTTSRTTDLRILLSSLSKITQECTGQSTLGPDSWKSLVLGVDSLFGAGVLSLRSTLALSAAESATSSTPRSSQGEGAKSAHEPIILARKPFPGTVAANTLEWGTGGLNVDSCRIEGKPRTTHADGNTLARSIYDQGQSYDESAHDTRTEAPAGRWPANVVLDPDTAKALDQQSGITKDGVAVNRNRTDDGGNYEASSYRITKTTREDQGYGGQGGASRFFKVAEPDPPFMYAAKAPKRERPTYTGEDGQQVQHPTVKPVSVIRWLVRLVTPVGGTVLDPFGGSGTTLEAATLEGMDPILIEAHGPYIPLIKERLSRVAIG